MFVSSGSNAEVIKWEESLLYVAKIKLLMVFLLVDKEKEIYKKC